MPSTPPARTLSAIRQDIDQIDQELLGLLLRRMDCSKEVAAYKLANGLPVLNIGREQEILDRIRQNAGSEYGDAAALIFSAVMDVSRGLQHRRMAGGQPLRDRLASASNALIPPAEARVACSGRAGAYAHEAACRLFPGGPLPRFVSSFAEVFAAVEEGSADYGVVPVENSSTGSVHEVYDLMMQSQFSIAAAAELPVQHCLLGIRGADPAALRTVYSHPQALSQCSAYLAARGLEVRPYSNTAAAAEMVAAAGDPHMGAVASRVAGDLYNLDILDENIQNVSENTTRFLAISSRLTLPPDADRISLIFTLPHVTGSLYRTLARFAMQGLNLTKLESRPVKNGEFEYAFYLDFEGNLGRAATVDLLCALSEDMPVFTFLGNYRELSARRP